ncbi:MAG: Na+ dependent nucleoside transporter domain protein [Planctomycetes bacterium]|nr:Na+ dependent nucleoside transporter domain protein [Planctomycetota bacterium]
MSAPTPASPSAADEPPPPETPLPRTPWKWRIAIAGAVAVVGAIAYALHTTLGYRFQAGCGILCFLGVAAFFSNSLQSVKRKTLLWGIGLQFTLASAVIYSPQIRVVFETVGDGIKALITASDKGADFVFGPLAKPVSPPSNAVGAMGSGLMMAAELEQHPPQPFIFAFKALPPIIFVSSFFSVLYYLGVLQFFVRIMAGAMRYIMGTSGAETLSVSANVFMGQTEAPLIVKPFVPKMTRSELLALMSSGMAHISGGMMAVYISYGADPVAILSTCVMACPCALYLTKLVYPEAGKPATAGETPITVETPYVNAVDAAAAGVKDGLLLAMNVAAMLIAFIAFIALFDIILGGFFTGLTLQKIFAVLFSPVAFLLGVDPSECDKVGALLGIKLAANEHVAYLTLGGKMPDSHQFTELSQRSKLLAVYALTGFANFASVGIQLGGIGAIAPGRRADLAKLGMKALFVGFLATLINAAVAGLLM